MFQYKIFSLPQTKKNITKNMIIKNLSIPCKIKQKENKAALFFYCTNKKYWN